MKEWKLDKKKPIEVYPNMLLQKYANSLTKQTKGVLSGQVTEAISYDSIELPHFVYALHIYLSKIKQSFRLIEVVQLKETVYPVNVRVFFYTGVEEHNNLQTPKDLEDKLDALVISPGVSMLITHFLNLSQLKSEEE
jgi:hypothetical protein